MIHLPTPDPLLTRLGPQYREARAACEVALQQVRATAPLRGDYVSGRAFDAALREHDERIAHLMKIIYEMTCLYERCCP